jgi:flavin-binding protein dodecin
LAITLEAVAGKEAVLGYARCMARIQKTVRLIGSSPNSIEDAVRTVLARAAITIRDIERFEVVRVGGTVDASGVPSGFEATVDINFVVKEAIDG